MTDNMFYDVTGISDHKNLITPALNQSGHNPKEGPCCNLQGGANKVN